MSEFPGPEEDLERIHALLPPCPTCGGNDGRSRFSSAAICPDCVDGKASVEWCIATFKAVWEPSIDAAWNTPKGLLDYLRSVEWERA